MGRGKLCCTCVDIRKVVPSLFKTLFILLISSRCQRCSPLPVGGRRRSAVEGVRHKGDYAGRTEITQLLVEAHKQH